MLVLAHSGVGNITFVASVGEVTYWVIEKNYNDWMKSLSGNRANQTETKNLDMTFIKSYCIVNLDFEAGNTMGEYRYL